MVCLFCWGIMGFWDIRLPQWMEVMAAKHVLTMGGIAENWKTSKEPASMAMPALVATMKDLHLISDAMSSTTQGKEECKHSEH